MKILLWWPGASVAVHDVAAGLEHGLRQHGAELVLYRTDVRLEAAGKFLDALWRQRGRVQDERPSIYDVVYQASSGVLEMALRHQVDWVISVSGLYQAPDFLALLRRAGIRAAFVCTESPYDLAAEMRVARLVDHVWTNERSTLDTFRTVQPSTSYLPHAWHPLVHTPSPAPVDVPAHDVVFVGTGFIERVQWLEAVDWTDIDFGLYGNWSLAGSRSKLRKHLREGSISNTRAAALYRRAAIGLNLHRTSTRYGRQTRHVLRAESLNPRAYELAACGGLTISDWRPEVDEIFGPAGVTVASPQELGTMVRHWLHAGSEARAARAAAQRAAIERHTWEARAAVVLADLQHAEALRRAA